MAEANHPADDNDIFIYTGGRVPRHLRDIITHATIDPSVSVIDDYAFCDCPRLRSVKFHDGVERIRKRAFMNCTSMRAGIKLLGVKSIDLQAFESCTRMRGVEFGDVLETIGHSAFNNCNSVRRIKIKCSKQTYGVIRIEESAFGNCGRLTDVDIPEGIGTIRREAFSGCINLRRISLPLKTDMMSADCPPYNVPLTNRLQSRGVFDWCNHLTTVDIVGGIHKTVSYLSLDSWRNAMKEEFSLINQILPNIPAVEKTAAIKQWIDSVLREMEYYKHEHRLLLTEAAALLELALWKAKLDEKEDEGGSVEANLLRLNIDDESARKERRITCGADVVIKNVLSFLTLVEDST
jgi:hypothetical protein